MAALGRFSVTLLMKTGLMSIQAGPLISVPCFAKVTDRSCAVCRFSQNSSVVSKGAPAGLLCPALTARSDAMMLVIRFGGTSMSRLSALALKPSGIIYSSRRISPGWCERAYLT